VEKRRFIKELAKRESASVGVKASEAVEEISGIKLVKRDFKGSIDVNRMVQTANEMIKRDEAMVAIFSGSDGANARILVMAGKIAVQKGVDAGFIVREASMVLGGGGGGKSNFAQAGGTKPDKLAEAIEKSQQVLKRQLKA